MANQLEDQLHFGPLARSTLEQYVNPKLFVKEQLEQTRAIDLIGRENVYMLNEYVGKSMEDACIDAQRWIEARLPDAEASHQTAA